MGVWTTPETAAPFKAILHQFDCTAQKATTPMSLTLSDTNTSLFDLQTKIPVFVVHDSPVPPTLFDYMLTTLALTEQSS